MTKDCIGYMIDLQPYCRQCGTALIELRRSADVVTLYEVDVTNERCTDCGDSLREDEDD